MAPSSSHASPFTRVVVKLSLRTPTAASCFAVRRSHSSPFDDDEDAIAEEEECAFLVVTDALDARHRQRRGQIVPSDSHCCFVLRFSAAGVRGWMNDDDDDDDAIAEEEEEEESCFAGVGETSNDER